MIVFLTIFVILSVIVIIDIIFDNVISYKYSNFVRLPTIETGEKYNIKKTEFGIIDQKTGFVFKKVVRRKVFKNSLYWQFVDNGKITFGFTVSELATADTINTLLEKTKCD